MSRQFNHRGMILSGEIKNTEIGTSSDWKISERQSCIICESEELQEVVAFPNFPVYLGCTDKSSTHDEFLDMVFDSCENCDGLQVRKFPPLEIVYGEAHADAVGGVWRRHHRAFSNFLNRWAPKNIFEIGGGAGRVALDYLDSNMDAKWTLIDANPQIKGAGTLRVQAAWFDESFVFDTEVDCIVHTHTLEHMLDPSKFLRVVASHLSPEQLHCFSVPNLRVMLSRGQPNSVNFEHTVFLDEQVLDEILESAGFKLLEKQYQHESLSIFYATKRATSEREPNFRSGTSSKKLLQQFIENNKSIVDNLNNKMKTLDGPIYLFGASIFSQYLIAFGLDKSKLVGLIDNSQMKIGRRLFGTNLSVYHPSEISNHENPTVISLMGQYQDEIVSQLRSISPTVQILGN